MQTEEKQQLTKKFTFFRSEIRIIQARAFESLITSALSKYTEIKGCNCVHGSYLPIN